MNARHLIPAALIALAGAASLPAFAGQLGNELTDQPQAESTLTRAQVVAETRAARGTLERSSYDEQESVALAHQHQDQSTTSRAKVVAETRAYFRSHPNSEYDRDTYNVGG